MLMQLVCVDRRYQRMNCFNIRELQGVLKRKFFTDLVNTNDHRDFLNQSIIGLRFKSNNQLSITPDLESFFNFGTTTNTKNKTNSFTNSYFNLKNDSLSLPSTLNFSFLFSNVSVFLSNLATFIISLNLNSLFSLTSIFNVLKQTIISNLNITFSTELFEKQNLATQALLDSNNTINYSTDNLNSSNNIEKSNNLLSETSNNVRFTRFNNPLISYDYKCGHYLGI